MCNIHYKLLRLVFDSAFRLTRHQNCRIHLYLYSMIKSMFEFSEGRCWWLIVHSLHQTAIVQIGKTKVILVELSLLSKSVKRPTWIFGLTMTQQGQKDLQIWLSGQKTISDNRLLGQKTIQDNRPLGQQLFSVMSPDLNVSFLGTMQLHCAQIDDQRPTTALCLLGRHFTL